MKREKKNISIKVSDEVSNPNFNDIGLFILEFLISAIFPSQSIFYSQFFKSPAKPVKVTVLAGYNL